MTFNKCTTGVLIDSGFTISIFAPTCNTVGSCIVLNSGNAWVAVIDGKSISSGNFFTSNVGFPNFMLENISKDTTNSNMVTVGGSVKVGGVTSLGTYIYGNTYGANPIYQTNPTASAVSRPAALAPGGLYPVISAPQYAGTTVSGVINLKDANQNGGFTLHGDGSTDDTAALQGALNTATELPRLSRSRRAQSSTAKLGQLSLGLAAPSLPSQALLRLYKSAARLARRVRLIFRTYALP
jgi:hypothetical protein